MLYDCIIIGAGPGGLQAAIYLGRFNRKVLIIDRTGGRTAHAKLIQNFLSQKAISGIELIERGLEQARSFGVSIKRETVSRIEKGEFFSIISGTSAEQAKFVIASSGVVDRVPPIGNYHRFLGRGFYTCVDCDGYHTTGKKLLIIGNAIQSVRLAFGMREMFTRDITLNLILYDPPPDYREELAEQGITLIKGTPAKILGAEAIEAVEMKDGSRISCEAIMSNFGYDLNDSYLAHLGLNKDPRGHKYVTNTVYESSLPGLYIVGPLNTGNDQVVIAAGEGAVAAIDINKRLMSF